ncbi:YqaJ viral recombinase family protein [Lysobacter yananisis]|uniref:YqaJ viral recombinase family protein n=1 Tax=Lysobacter yananisis TaxID=1003114 RepID=A0ABY9PA07_9GAMM|nr:YqaJ viral recombinase family protein [Lysobacter yananisis]WMT02845.1 YqaJ viral recombinase family protein [Lysobacter yananisis]
MKWHDVEQNTPEWDALRLGKATASNYGKFMANYDQAFGEPAKSYALQIALERVTGNKAEYSFRNEDMERGHEQEPIARMLYEEVQFADVARGGFFDWGDYGDSPDGLIDDDGVIEIKCVIASTHRANIRRGKPDPAYKWQIVGHLDGTGRQWVDFVSYCSDYPEHKQLAVFRTYRSEVEAELAQLSERRDRFLELVRAEVEHLKQKAA